MELPHIGHYRDYLSRGLSQPKNGRFLEFPEIVHVVQRNSKIRIPLKIEEGRYSSLERR